MPESSHTAPTGEPNKKSKLDHYQRSARLDDPGRGLQRQGVGDRAEVVPAPMPIASEVAAVSANSGLRRSSGAA
jgi:hypothetical protein